MGIGKIGKEPNKDEDLLHTSSHEEHEEEEDLTNHVKFENTLNNVVFEDDPENELNMITSPDKSHIDAENDCSNNPPEKKLRVSTAAAHQEFEEDKDENGRWRSKCKHCDTVYRHKNSSSLLVHLEKKHAAVHKKCMEEDRKERDAKERERQLQVLEKAS